MFFKVGDSVRVKPEYRDNYLWVLGEKLVDDNIIVCAKRDYVCPEYYAVKAINGWRDIDKGQDFGGISESYYYIPYNCLELIHEKDSSNVYYNALRNMAKDIIKNYDMNISLDEFVNKYIAEAR